MLLFPHTRLKTKGAFVSETGLRVALILSSSPRLYSASGWPRNISADAEDIIKIVSKSSINNIMHIDNLQLNKLQPEEVYLNLFFFIVLISIITIILKAVIRI